MDFAKIDGYTRVFGKPNNWNEDSGECVDLYVKDIQFPDSNVMVTEWKPDPGELEQLNNGGSLFLWIYGTIHPPIAMTVEPIKVPEAAKEEIEKDCTLPPLGWECTRGSDHDGPCAAWPIWVDIKEHLPAHGQSIIGCNSLDNVWTESFDPTLSLEYMTAWRPYTEGVPLKEQLGIRSRLAED